MKPADPLSEIKKALAVRYIGETPEQLALINVVSSTCEKHITNGWGGANGKKGLCSTDRLTYKECLSEVLVAHLLDSKGIKFEFPKEGPDFFITKDQKKIWIEVITPKPEGLPKEWLARDNNGKVIEYPNDKILLRWTSAIKEKKEKLEGYLKNGTVSQDDVYVIAVNGVNLRDGFNFPKPEGISQYPFAVEAMFGLGAQQIHINRETLKAEGSSHIMRTTVPKNEAATVPVGAFIDPEKINLVASTNISAVWALDIDEMCLVRDSGPTSVVHNPLAKNPLEVGFLPAYSEYVCKLRETDWQLTKLPGTIS